MSKFLKLAIFGMFVTENSVLQAKKETFGQKCSKNSDCKPNDWEFCNIKISKSDAKTENFGICDHKGPFPMKSQEFWGFIVIFALLWYTNLGGIPGAGLILPISIYFFEFDVKNAVAFSNFSIFGSSFVRYFGMIS